MTAHALITGQLHKAAVTRTSASGKPFATATVRYQQKNREGETETLFCSCLAFRSETRETLAQLQEGDTVSVGGPLTVGIWTDKDGQPKPSLSLIAETCATAKPRPREPMAGRKPGGADVPMSRPELDRGGFDDEVPF